MDLRPRLRANCGRNFDYSTITTTSPARTWPYISGALQQGLNIADASQWKSAVGALDIAEPKSCEVPACAQRRRISPDGPEAGRVKRDTSF